MNKMKVSCLIVILSIYFQLEKKNKMKYNKIKVDISN